MKWFVDAYLLNKEFQGTRTYISALYKGMARKHQHIQFYFGMFYNQEIEKEFESFSNIHFIHLKYSSRLRRMVNEIPSIIENEKMDFAHFQYMIPFRLSKSCKYIVTIHDLLFNEEKDLFSYGYRLTRNLWFKWSAKRADNIFTVSNYSRDSIHRFYNIPYAKIGITSNGVSQKYFADYDKIKAVKHIEEAYGFSNYILYVSRIEPRKNQALLIESFLKLGLSKQGYNLVLIGKRSLEYKDFENLLRDKGVEQGIYYFEQVSEKDLFDFYKGASAFVYPSKAEGFGIPPIEAGALKIPVLCSNATALSDFSFFEPFTFNPFDGNNFSDILKKFIGELNEIDTESIRNIIHENYSWEHTVDQLSRVLDPIE